MRPSFSAFAALATLAALAALALTAFAAGPARAEPIGFADLQGATIEANWIEDLVFRPEKEKQSRSVRSPRQVTLNIGPGDAIAHQMIRTAGKSQRTDERKMQLNKTQPSGIGFVRWDFEDGKLVYTETLFSGARRLIVALDRKDGKITCAISVMVAREGNKPVLTLSLANSDKVELLDIKTAGGDCTVTKK